MIENHWISKVVASDIARGQPFQSSGLRSNYLLKSFLLPMHLCRHYHHVILSYVIEVLSERRRWIIRSFLTWEEFHKSNKFDDLKQKWRNPARKGGRKKKHTTIGIRWWSPTQLLIDRSTAYVWQSGRDAQLFVVCGRMCKVKVKLIISTFDLASSQILKSTTC